MVTRLSIERSIGSHWSRSHWFKPYRPAPFCFGLVADGLGQPELDQAGSERRLRASLIRRLGSMFESAARTTPGRLTWLAGAGSGC